MLPIDSDGRATSLQGEGTSLSAKGFWWKVESRWPNSSRIGFSVKNFLAAESSRPPKANSFLWPTDRSGDQDFKMRIRDFHHNISLLSAFWCVETHGRYKSWWSRKKSKFHRICHSGESRNPVISISSGPRLSPGWRLRRLFTKSSNLISFVLKTDTFKYPAPFLFFGAIRAPTNNGSCPRELRAPNFLIFPNFSKWLWNMPFCLLFSINWTGIGASLNCRQRL